MILATGFRYSFPFLPQYYDGATYGPHAGSAATVLPFLPMDGSHIRDLYLDQFYLQDPTLAFLGCSLCFVLYLCQCSLSVAVALGTSTFLSAEYTALALAKVWTNTAKLPNTETMQALYDKTVEERGGFGKYVLFLAPGQFFGVSFGPCRFLALTLRVS